MAQLNHLALAVRDPARSLAFYRDTIGVSADVRTESYGFVLRTPTGITYTLFNGEPCADVGDFHIGVGVPDAAAVYRARERFSLLGLVEREWSDEPGYVSVKVIDPDGYVVEVAWDEHDAEIDIRVERAQEQVTMTPAPDRRASERLLHTAVVLSTTEQACTVYANEHRAVLPYHRSFPEARVERVAPGHLVAVATPTHGTAVVVWRWFDAVVLADDGGSVELWEPAHGALRATRRDQNRTYRSGTRAYLSAGLPGAQWWVAGSVVDRAEDADVDVDQVEQFFNDFDLWTS